MAKYFFLLLILFSFFANADKINKNASPMKVGLTTLYTDNFNPTLIDKENTSLIKLFANGELVSINDELWLQAKYSGQYIKTDNKDSASETNSFTQGDVSLLGRLYLQPNFYINTSLEYKHENELFGSGLSKLRHHVVNADKYNQTNFLIAGTYGAASEDRTISLSYQQSDKKYSAINFYSQLFSLLQKKLSLKTKFKLSANTQFVALIELQKDNYDSLLREDSDKQQIMLGMDWQTSGISTFSFLLGKYQRTPENTDKSTGLVWKLSYQYAPRDDFQVDLLSSQTSIAGQSEVASNSELQAWQARLNYLYSKQWTYYARASFEKTLFQEPLKDHTLKNKFIELGVSYNIHNYHKIQLIVTNRDVTDSNGSIDYRQNEVGVHWLYDF